MTVSELIENLEALNIPNAIVMDCAGDPITGWVYDDKEIEFYTDNDNHTISL